MVYYLNLTDLVKLTFDNETALWAISFDLVKLTFDNETALWAISLSDLSNQ